MIPTLQLGGLGIAMRSVLGGGGGGGTTTLNPLDKHANLALSGADLVATKSGASAWTSVRSTTGKSAGKLYFEGRFLSSGGTGGGMIGVMPAADSLSGHCGASANGLGYYANNSPPQAYNNGAAVNSGGTALAVNGYAGVAVDVPTGKVWVRNSASTGWQGGGNPAAGTSPTFTLPAGQTLYVALSLYFAGDSWSMNFGATAFNMPVPAGFMAWDGTSAPTYADPYWPYTVLLISGEGVNGSTSFTDLTGNHSITANGMTAVSTGDSDFPNGAIDTDGSGSDYLSVSGQASDWDFGTRPFTVETRFKLDATASGDGAYFLSNYTGAGAGWALHVMPGSGSIRFLLGSTNIVRTFTVTNGVLYHVEVTRDASGHVRFFVNGAQIGATDTTTLNGVNVGNPSVGLILGAEGPPYTSFGQWDGRQGWARVTNGIARHVANFTPETSPYATV